MRSRSRCTLVPRARGAAGRARPGRAAALAALVLASLSWRPTPLAAAGQLYAQITPSTITPDTEVTMTGGGFCPFPPCTPITVQAGQKILARQVMVNQDGTFGVKFVVREYPGSYMVQATQIAGDGATVLGAAAPLTVVLSLAAAAPQPAPAPLLSAPPLPHDQRYFAQTGFRVDVDAAWTYFNLRGGAPVFGYPVSRPFTLQGFTVQVFQRHVIQVDPWGQARPLSLPDDQLPYTSFNGSVVPAPDPALVAAAPSPRDQAAGLAFVRAHAPDVFNGLQVAFAHTFFSTVPFQAAYPQGNGDPSLLPAFDLELWGIPTSQPAPDPGNPNVVYLRFQRGIMAYNRACGCTQGLLLGEYLKAVLTGVNLPIDLAQEAQASPLYRQYDLSRPQWLRDPSQLPGTDLTGAFVAG